MARWVTVRLANIVIFGYHGAFEEEGRLGQRFEVDLEYRYDASRAMESDRLADAASYVDVFAIVQETVGGRRHHLLERLGALLLEALRGRLDLAWIRVRLRKPSVPLPGALDHVEVELEWSASDPAA